MFCFGVGWGKVVPSLARVERTLVHPPEWDPTDLRSESPEKFLVAPSFEGSIMMGASSAVG